MKASRLRVVPLYRFESKNGSLFYCFAGRTIGPFPTEEDRQVDIDDNFIEVASTGRGDCGLLWNSPK